jgi:exodeoxyribonuclease VII large subunit
VFHDIQNVIRRRYPLVELVLSPTQVQGDNAAPQIVAALERLERDGRSDLIIVARGGGSLEELWPFNEETVARAIYASRIPVVSAVGHETDVTIADLVADLRAPTPSAAAELAAPDMRELKEALGRFAGQLERGLLDPIKRDRANVDQARRQLESGLPDIGVLRRRIDDVTRIAVASAGKLMVQSRLEVDGLHQRLRGLDPRATLERGFSIVKSSGSGKVIDGTGQVKPGEALTIIVSDGDYAAVAGVPASVNTNVEAKTNTNANGRSRRKQAKPDPGMTRLL